MIEATVKKEKSDPKFNTKYEKLKPADKKKDETPDKFDERVEKREKKITDHQNKVKKDATD